MKETEIDLFQPFERVLEAVLALPHRSAAGALDDRCGEKELRQAIRGLYEAANGRQVETGLGLIPIAPPVAPYLKAIPFRAATLKDFMVAAAAQIVAAMGEIPLRRRTDTGKPRTNADLRWKKQIRAHYDTLFHRRSPKNKRLK